MEEGTTSQRCCSLSSLRTINPVSDFFSLVQSNVKEVLDSRSPLSLDWRIYQLNVEAIEWMKEAGTTETIPGKLKEFKAKYQEEVDRFYEQHLSAMKPTHPKEDMEARMINDHHLHAKQALEQSLSYANAHLFERTSMIYVETEEDKHYLNSLHNLLSEFSSFLT